MCGIVGYVGARQPIPEVIRGLEQLEYRGYDSAGVARLNGDRDLSIVRTRGRVERLRHRVAQEAANSDPGGVCLGHTRWATHGAPTEHNAHPHTDCGGELALVHNGIIENHGELRELLRDHGHTFRSETDTEVLAHLIEDELEEDLLDAVLAILPRIEGAYALAVVRARVGSERIIAARRGSPLIIGIGDGEAFVASDAAAIIERTRTVIYLEEGDVADIRRDRVRVLDAQRREVHRPTVAISWSAEAVKKNGYRHFMRKEIDEQPGAIAACLKDRISMVERPTRIPELDRLLADGGVPRRIVVVGCGTSWHAALVGKTLIEEMAGIPVEVDTASELRYRDPLIDPESLVIAISQSGETADTLAAVHLALERGARVLGICNVVGSTLARLADEVLQTRAGPEIGVASTKAFTTQLAVLAMIAAHLAHEAGTFPPAEMLGLMKELAEAGPLVEEMISRESAVEEAAVRHSGSRCFMFLGRGPDHALAAEGALKLKELAYVPACAHPAGEIKHGPIALVDDRATVVVIATASAVREKTLSSMEEVRARGAQVVALVTDGDHLAEHLADSVIRIPRAGRLTTVLLVGVALQLFAYHAADHLGLDIDKPRNLAKSVTVE